MFITSKGRAEKVPSHPQFMLDFFFARSQDHFLMILRKQGKKNRSKQSKKKKKEKEKHVRFGLPYFSLLIHNVVWEYLANTSTNADSHWVGGQKKAELVFSSRESESAKLHSHWDREATRALAWNSSNHRWLFSCGRVADATEPDEAEQTKEKEKKRQNHLIWPQPTRRWH